VKLQPHTTNFLDITNHRAVLEVTLSRGFAALTQGDIIVITFAGRQYPVSVLECKPARAVSIIETDMQVDFAAPLDYVEPQPKHTQAQSQSAPAPAPAAMAASPAKAISFGNSQQKNSKKLQVDSDDESSDSDESSSNEEQKFVPFTGKAYSLK
jgi:ubiquitin fusion degradation protein 1